MSTEIKQTVNDALITRLRGSLASGRFSHAYLFIGPKGTGKKTLAKFAAKTLLCQDLEDKPCGRCLSCLSFENGNHPDAIFIEPDKKTTISAEMIRGSVVNDANVKPYRSAYKVYIINHADLMQSASQNILLKTLEEPPAYGVFLLCAENPALLLPTVVSRCVAIKTAPLGLQAAAELLMRDNPDANPSDVLFCAALAGGGVGRARELLEIHGDGKPKAVAVREALLSVLLNIGGMDPAEVLLRSKGLEEFKDDADLILDLAGTWFRDIAVYSQLGDSGLINADLSDLVSGQADNIDFVKAAGMLDIIEEARGQLRHNVGFQIVTEVLMLRIYKFVKNNG